MPAAVAEVLENDDLLWEILLRLAPDPSSLPRASLVCHRWRRLVSDSDDSSVHGGAGFLRRFRRRHRHRNNPLPLIGFLDQRLDQHLHLVPTLDPPDRVPPGRFYLRHDDRDPFRLVACRHGLLLLFYTSRNKLDTILVWDPISDDRRYLDSPPGLSDATMAPFHGAVVRTSAGSDPKPDQYSQSQFQFQVVLVATDATDYDQPDTHAFACVYSSETGEWGDLISTPVPPDDISRHICMVYPAKPAVLAGGSLFWLLMGGEATGLLEFDLGTHRLAVSPVPVDMYMFDHGGTDSTLLPAEDGRLGFLFLSGFTAQFWNRRIDSGRGGGGGASSSSSWVLGRTVELDKILPLNSAPKGLILMVLGVAEDSNLAFLLTPLGVFMVQLESFQVLRQVETNVITCYFPFESVCTPETSIGGGRERAELLLDS